MTNEDLAIETNNEIWLALGGKPSWRCTNSEEYISKWQNAAKEFAERQGLRTTS